MITPLGQRILVKKLPRTTASGIILPEQADVKQHKAEIVKLGHKVEYPFVIGDTIIINDVYTELDDYDKDFVLVHEGNVLGVDNG